MPSDNAEHDVVKLGLVHQLAEQMLSEEYKEHPELLTHAQDRAGTASSAICDIFARPIGKAKQGKRTVKVLFVRAN